MTPNKRRVFLFLSKVSLLLIFHVVEHLQEVRKIKGPYTLPRPLNQGHLTDISVSKKCLKPRRRKRFHLLTERIQQFFYKFLIIKRVTKSNTPVKTELYLRFLDTEGGTSRKMGMYRLRPSPST